MNIIDFIIILIMLVFTGIGYYRGFFKVVMNLVEYILSIFLAWKFHPSFAELLNEKFLLNDFMHNIILNGMKNVIENNIGEQAIEVPLETLDIPMVRQISTILVSIIAMFVLFLIFKLLLKLITFLVEKLTKLPVLKEFNKIGGVVAGFIEGVIIIFISLAIVNVISNETLDKKLEESLLGDTFSSVVTNFTVSLISNI